MPVCFLEEFIAEVITVREGSWQEAGWLRVSSSPIEAPEAAFDGEEGTWDVPSWGKGHFFFLLLDVDLCKSQALWVVG